MKIVIVPELVIRRSLKERLFSRPWRPFATHKPDPKILQFNEEALIMHPETFKRAQEIMRQEIVNATGVPSEMQGSMRVKPPGSLL